VGATAIIVTQNPQSAISAALPVLLLGLPILDTLMVMAQRIVEHRSPFQADRNHIHHKLLALGLEHHEAVMAIYLVQCALFLAAYFLRFEPDGYILGSFAVFACGLIGTWHVAQIRGWRLHGESHAPRKSLLARQIRRLRAPDCLPQWTFLFICVSVPTYGLLVIARAAVVTTDLTWLAGGLLIASALVLPWFWRRDLGWIEKTVTYVAAVSVVYLDQVGPEQGRGWSLAYFALLAVAVALRFRLVGDRRLQVTPLDVIVLFIALVVPNLPGAVHAPPAIALGIAKIVVLLYAIEVILSAPLRWNLSRAVVALVLVALATRGMLPLT
jgi:UDP-GlcNAc:undecaprenyl-phosphate GlcNAc-1-phosphate transferase